MNKYIVTILPLRRPQKILMQKYFICFVVSMCIYILLNIYCDLFN